MRKAVCCQPSKGLETSKRMSRLGEVSLVEHLQGSQGYPGARVTFYNPWAIISKKLL